MTDSNKLYPKSYGDWAGNPKGIPPDFKRCCEEVRTPGRFFSYAQCQRPRGHGPDKAYCKQHDPEAVKAREQKARTEHDRKYRLRMREVYGSTFLAALRKIANGHNDPRGLATEIVSDFDARYGADEDRPADAMEGEG